MELNIDPNDLELGEVEFFEEQSGLSLGDLQNGVITTKAIIALITVTERRKNPAFTMEDARKLKLGDIAVEVADPPAPPRRARSKP